MTRAIDHRCALAALALALTLGPAPATAAPRTWRLARELPVAAGTMVAAFLDERTGLTTGCNLVFWRSTDGGSSWSPRLLRHLCRYGLELVPGLAVDTGNLGYQRTGEVALSTDGGVTWALGAPFGGAVPHHVRHLSFVDATRGLVATDVAIGLTTDGARSWRPIAPPERARRVAAVSLAGDGRRLVLRVLDESGALWRSNDGGGTWASAPSPLTGGVLEAARGPTAALRFTGSAGVLAASVDGPGGLASHVYRTVDDGATWVEEPLSPPLAAAILTLDPLGALLTALHVGSDVVRLYRVESPDALDPRSPGAQAAEEAPAGAAPGSATARSHSE